MTRDQSFTSTVSAANDLSSVSWAGKVYMELPAKSQTELPSSPLGNFTPRQGFSGFGIASSHYQAYAPGAGATLTSVRPGRNGLGLIQTSGRDFISPMKTIETLAYTYYLARDLNLLADSVHYRVNPYLLYPTDQLVMGWQQPIFTLMQSNITGSLVAALSRNAGTGSFSTISFLPGTAKVTLYGSYIREGKEHNDGTNQLLSSPAAHEVIG